MVKNKATKKNNKIKKKKNKFWSIVGTILFKKLPEEKENEDKYTTMAFSFLTSLMFFALGYGLLILSLLSLIGMGIYFISIYNWSNIVTGIIIIIYFLLLVFICFIISVLMIGAAKEQTSGKRDNEKTITVFSALVSLIALIISFVALIK